MRGFCVKVLPALIGVVSLIISCQQVYYSIRHYPLDATTRTISFDTFDTIEISSYMTLLKRSVNRLGALPRVGLSAICDRDGPLSYSSPGLSRGRMPLRTKDMLWQVTETRGRELRHKSDQHLVIKLDYGVWFWI